MNLVFVTVYWADLNWSFLTNRQDAKLLVEKYDSPDKGSIGVEISELQDMTYSLEKAEETLKWKK